MDCLGAITHEKKQEKKTFVGPYAQFVIMDPLFDGNPFVFFYAWCV